MTNFDVLVVGAGPAGAVAATVLARAGARVRLIDRAAFPRDKLCGDTLNPGALALLRRLGLSASIEERGLPVHGMRVTGEHGVVIEGRYPGDLCGRALVRRDVDWALLSGAMAAGAAFEPSVAVRRAIVDERAGGRVIRGVVAGAERSERALHAPVTIAADGRHSTLAFALGLARHPRWPRRWAVGAYFENVGNHPAGLSTVGEMHVRRGRYIGVAPVPGPLTNVCFVKPSAPGDPSLHDPAAALRQELARDPMLRDRFAHARLVHPPVVIGPLAVDACGTGIDGLRFAIRGGELAAVAALEALEHGWAGVHDRLAARRQREFGAKWRFNRALRALVASPLAVAAAALGARVAPGVLQAVINNAGDCDVSATCPA